MTELHLQLLRTLEANPRLTQRELARDLGISLGRTNYALRALMEKGWIKAQRFGRSDHKRGYLDRLTPRGIASKAQLAIRFLQKKQAEHEALWQEIQTLRAEVEEADRNS